ncbi:MAG TPA: leucyl aminopeptidase [Actinomycetota bacterium]|nr:leucyl aminopeptidase [Actinomycetota bacterium]
MPQIVSSQDDVTSLACDALVVGAHERDDGFELSPPAAAIDDTFGGHLHEALTQFGFKANPGNVQVIPTLGNLPAGAIVVVGLGSDAPVQLASVRRAAAAAARRVSERHQVASALHEGIKGGERAAAEGFLLGSYRFSKYKKHPGSPKIERIVMPGADADEIERGIVYAEATSLARDLTNEPADVLTPAELADRARAAADVGGFECSILDERGLRSGGYGGLLAVGGGSAAPPRLVRLRYVGPDAGVALPKIALIGKGITYDSGGLTIKPAANMETMKTDMGGGAAVIAAVTALARLRAAADVVAYIPCAENMIGPAAMRPGDVIHHYGGRTTEMVNADAEGRLVLADAIARANEDEPAVVVDIATLTGHISVALGKKIAGLFATDDELATELMAAGEAAGERFWRMPLPDDYMSDLDSDIADAKNSGSRYGGGITAALFLKAFVAPGTPWAHLDIAGTGRAESEGHDTPKGATGFGTRTLIEWVEGRAK